MLSAHLERPPPLPSHVRAQVTGGASILPEEVGASASEGLLREISDRGVVDSANQALLLTLMSLGPEDVSVVRLGELTPFTVGTLRLLKEFFGVTFQIDPDPHDGGLLLSCRGVGFVNLAKRTT